MNSTLKAILKQVLPPSAIALAKRIRDLGNQAGAPKTSPSPSLEFTASPAPSPPPPSPSPTPPSEPVAPLAKPAVELPEWEAVRDSDAVWTAHEGWAHHSIANLQRERWPSFVASLEGKRPFGWHDTKPGEPVDVSMHNTIVTFGHVLGCASGGRTRISILDWGGGAGQYLLYGRKLRPDLQLDYVVMDLPSLCQVGREVNPKATFVSDDAQALGRRYDLVFASSSVQYSRDLYGLLARICDATAGWLMVTRSPFVEHHDDFVVVQRPYKYGYMSEYACWFINRHRFISFIEAKGLTLQREFMLGERPYVPNAPEPCVYGGFLFKRTA